MKEENLNKKMSRFTRGKRQRGERESEGADAAMGLQREERELIVDAV